MEKTEDKKEFAIQWAKEGKPCYYRHGFAWKGASARRISKARALKELSHPGWRFGMGFYELSFHEINGEMALEFNELGENDLY